MSLHNPNCDGSDKTCTGDLEVRYLPLGGQGGLILCQACFLAEMRWRRQMREQGWNFGIPAWESLEVYSGAC